MTQKQTPRGEQAICKCGHKQNNHAFGGTGECYTMKHIKGCNYQCVCRKFEELVI